MDVPLREERLGGDGGARVGRLRADGSGHPRRRRDLPGWVSHVDEHQRSPRRAVLATGAGIAGLVLPGSAETTWSFSAFTVLVYYALTNLAALRLPAEQWRFPRILAWLGLGSCLGLAFWVRPRFWMVGLGLIAGGLLWHHLRKKAMAGPPGRT